DDVRLRARCAPDLPHPQRGLLRIPAAAAHRRGGDRRAQSRCNRKKRSGSDGRCAMKRALPWIVATVFAVAFVVALVAKRGGSNQIDGVTQDDSGRRVTAWIDPMYSQGPPHNYKSNQPGRAPDCGMKL